MCVSMYKAHHAIHYDPRAMTHVGPPIQLQAEFSHAAVPRGSFDFSCLEVSKHGSASFQFSVQDETLGASCKLMRMNT